MYSESKNDFQIIVDRIKKEAPDNFIKRFENNCKRQEQWVRYHRSKIIYRNHNTNNYAEASIRIMKDILLNRTKAYNVVALLDFIMSVGEEYFTLRILNHAHGRHLETQRLYTKLCSKMIDINTSDVKKINESTYVIPSVNSSSETYIVNIDNGVCTCKMGHTGSFCKHQAWIHKNIKSQLPNAPAVTLEERHALAMLALGSTKCPKPTFFLGLKENVSIASKSDDIENTDKNIQQFDNTSINSSNDIQNTIECPINKDSPIQNNFNNECNNSLNIEVKHVQNEWNRLQNMIPTLPPSILKKIGNRLSHVKNTSQFANLMCSLSSASSNINRRRGQIKVQPTSISRRKTGVTRGSCKINAGRRPSSQGKNIIKKRPHNLKYNVAQNQMNAKNH